MKSYFHKIGAICYILWGLLHIAFGALVLYRLGAEGGTAALAQIGTAVPRAELPVMTGVGSGLLAQHSGNLIVFGSLALVIGLLWNWRNRRLGYWLNLAVVSGADLSFVLAIVMPRYDTWVDGLAGPILWILGVIFSTLGICLADEE